MSLAAGTRLGQYEILVPISAGGMGEVYRASDTKLKREVALKVLPKRSPATSIMGPRTHGWPVHKR
jgi:serine/threonine protein kinase